MTQFRFDFGLPSATPGNGLLASAATATTNPSPNSLSVISPYNVGFPYPADPQKIVSAWTNQGTKAVFPNAVRGTEFNSPIWIAFNPSGGSAVTYTISYWKFCAAGGFWAKSAILSPGQVTAGQSSYTGPQLDYIQPCGREPWFLQVNSISSGTLAIYVNDYEATTL
jgi:hypothetical protein